MKFRYKQQLVLQLPANSVKDYDTLIDLENTIAAGLKNLGEIDGHDSGAGEMNIFVHTDNSKLAFEKIKSLIGTGSSRNLVGGFEVKRAARRLWSPKLAPCGGRTAMAGL